MSSFEFPHVITFVFVIAECGAVLKTIAAEIRIPLQSLTEVTWTTQELCAIIAGRSLIS